jgi:hypothetical protein
MSYELLLTLLLFTSLSLREYPVTSTEYLFYEIKGLL